MCSSDLTRTVKVNVPAVSGVPEMMPVEAEIESPLGRLPALIDHWNGPLPPLEATVCEYAVPTAGVASDAVVMLSGAAIRMEVDHVDVPPSAPVTLTVKFAVPAVVGVPETVAPESVSPAGRAPAEMDHV